MTRIARDLGRLPLVLRCTVAGAVALAVLVGVVALVAGLFDYPQTAWAAELEGSFLGGIVGGVLGFLVGVLAYLWRGVAHGIRRRSGYPSR